MKRNTMKYKAIIFDMDGTVIATEDIWKSATQKILDDYLGHLNQEEKDKIKKHLKGLALYESSKYIKEQSKIDITEEDIIKAKSLHAHTIFSQGIDFIPHFESFHKSSQDMGMKTAIATNATEKTVDHTLSMLPLENYFQEHIYHIDHVNKVCKPNPDVFLHAAKKIGMDPKDCIVIEDSAHGIQAAKAANMFCIGINTGQDREVLEKADIIVDCYSEIDLTKLLEK